MPPSNQKSLLNIFKKSDSPIPFPDLKIEKKESSKNANKLLDGKRRSISKVDDKSKQTPTKGSK